MLLSIQKQPTVKTGRPAGSRTFDPAAALAFGAVVKEQRHKAGLSQEELSNLANVERSHMGKIERGEHLPNLVLILRLAEALGIKPGKLVDKTADSMLEV